MEIIFGNNDIAFISSEDGCAQTIKDCFHFAILADDFTLFFIVLFEVVEETDIDFSFGKVGVSCFVTVA